VFTTRTGEERAFHCVVSNLPRRDTTPTAVTPGQFWPSASVVTGIRSGIRDEQ
jgi:hypothetical protein